MRFFRIRRRRRKLDPVPFNQHKESARSLAHERLAHWNQFYNHEYKRVAIRNQRSRWGSCSMKGNLNFNYRIALLPLELADYIIVHELCHLREFNHSERFWSLVAQTLPDYRERRVQLDKLNILLLSDASVDQ